MVHSVRIGKLLNAPVLGQVSLRHILNVVIQGEHELRRVVYKPLFSPPANVFADAALLVFDGIRMGAMIALNGHQLGNASDQFLRYTFPVGPLLKPAGQPNELSVVFGAELGIDCQGRWTRSNQPQQEL